MAAITLHNRGTNGFICFGFHQHDNSISSTPVDIFVSLLCLSSVKRCIETAEGLISEVFFNLDFVVKVERQCHKFSNEKD